MSERVTILLGSPGTGKTTACLEKIEQALASGVAPDRIAYLTFTRKAANEAVERACKKFNLSPSDFPYFKTLHSLAYSLLGLRKEDVISGRDLKELGSELGLVFSSKRMDTMERYETAGGSGDKCMTIYSLAKARMTDLHTEWQRSDFQDLPFFEVERFEKRLLDFKNRTFLLDFSDFFTRASGKVLNVELAIIDEAQDLTRQQWVFARDLLKNAKKIIIAGDDDQAIFEWAGADTDTFLNLKGKREVLPISYRLPRTVFNLADEVVNHIRHRYPKQWRPRDEEGSVNWWGDDPSYGMELNSGSWLMLARHTYQLQQFEQLCRGWGVVYKYNGEWSNQTEGIRSVIYYERLRRGESLGYWQTKLVTNYVGINLELKQKEFSWEDISWPFEGKPDWMTALVRLSTEEKEYVRALRRRGISLTATGDIIISTIHGSKGGEADNVMLCSDYSKKVEEVFENGETDSEYRVWYVGATRARKSLHIFGEKDFITQK